MGNQKNPYFRNKYLFNLTVEINCWEIECDLLSDLIRINTVNGKLKLVLYLREKSFSAWRRAGGNSHRLQSLLIINPIQLHHLALKGVL